MLVRPIQNIRHSEGLKGGHDIFYYSESVSTICLGRQFLLSLTDFPLA